MTTLSETQKQRWNQTAGCAWVESQAVIEGTLEGLVAPLDVECSMPASALMGYVSRLGPVGMAHGRPTTKPASA